MDSLVRHQLRSSSRPLGALNTGDSVSRLVSIAVLATVLLMGCATGNSSDPSEVESGADPIRDACSLALRASNTEPMLPNLTQCEVQLDSGRRIFVLQFQDPSQNRFEQGGEPTFDNLFYRPLEALRPVWASALEDSGIDQYIVAFQGPCQEVWDLEPAVVTDFVNGSVSADIVMNGMEISALSFC